MLADYTKLKSDLEQGMALAYLIGQRMKTSQPDEGPAITPLAPSGRLEDQPAVVVESDPPSGANDVSPGIHTLRVRFSKDMSHDSWSWATAWAGSAAPVLKESGFDADHRTNTIQVKLAPRTTYAYWINSDILHDFKDTHGIPAMPYLLIFHTKE